MDQSQTAQHNPKANNNKSRPENKDNMDSRKNEENDLKGGDSTHNKKEQHSEGKQKNNKS